MKDFYEAVYDLVAQIPKGCVMTYGQIAVLLGRPTGARAVGYALRQTPSERKIPWQRVINSQGRISPRGLTKPEHEPTLQQILLEKEGVEFDEQGKTELERYLWEPKQKRPPGMELWDE